MGGAVGGFVKNIDPSSRTGKALLAGISAVGGAQAHQAKDYLEGKQAEKEAEEAARTAPAQAEAAKKKAEKEKEEARRASVISSSASRGLSGTLLTGGLGAAATSKKTLLGQ